MAVVFLHVILQIYNYVFHLEAYYAREGGEAEISGGLDVDGLEGCVEGFLGWLYIMSCFRGCLLQHNC